MNMANGHLHPLKLCIGEARAATSLGVSIYEQSRVLDIEHGRRPRVVTQNGSVRADFVVIAGNAYHALEKKLPGIMFAMSWSVLYISLGIFTMKLIKNTYSPLLPETRENIK